MKMYFPVGWPRALSLPQADQCSIRQVICNRGRTLFAILTDDSLSIWFCKPCVAIVSHRRSQKSLEAVGYNQVVEWRQNSSMMAVATSGGRLLIYGLSVRQDHKRLYEQRDSAIASLKRDSAELFLQETIPALLLTLEQEVNLGMCSITSITCLREELMVATNDGVILRVRWDGTENRDYSLDLRRVPFCIDQQVSKAVPIVESNTHVVSMEFSPLMGGFAIVFNDGRAAFLTASTMMFDPNQTQGIWAQGIEDATCACVNHKYRLIAFGRKNSQAVVYCVDESTGGLVVSHEMVLSPKDYPGFPGQVEAIRWTPDCRCVALAWAHGGFSLWSTFGALLTCSLGWDYGDACSSNYLNIKCMEWSAEGYQLWMVRKPPEKGSGSEDGSDQPADTILILDCVKSALTVNPCMGHLSHLYLQGEDRLYINIGGTRSEEDLNRIHVHGLMPGEPVRQTMPPHSQLVGSKQWVVILLPSHYSAANWPIRIVVITENDECTGFVRCMGAGCDTVLVFKTATSSMNRHICKKREPQAAGTVITVSRDGEIVVRDKMAMYTALDEAGEHLAVAGQAGLAVYAMGSRRWKLFGSESQEQDTVVSGGLLWWRDHVVVACYTVSTNCDQLRLYPKDAKLDNSSAITVPLSRQALLINLLRDNLVTFCVAASVTIYSLAVRNTGGPGASVSVTQLQVIDMSVFGIHPTHVVSLALTAMRTETGRSHHLQQSQSIVLNVSGRLLTFQREIVKSNGAQCAPPTVLASFVEHVWVPTKSRRDKPHLTEALWIFCGVHGMRVWLPLFPKAKDAGHTFMSKRIMLPFQLRIYPLAILFEDAILLGAENDTMLYSSDAKSPFSSPFCVLERTSQVYLHQILRQLIRRNLGYHAWEIARSCTALPYFPHSLELLLHEVLEEEATSKEPIPDALLPSVVEFIQEFPVYLETVAHCARKTEIALWPYLFAAAGKPKDLFQECLSRHQLDTAASYLIILQNLEPSAVSRQYATLLLDAALNRCQWDLSKDLVRFLRAIDPNDVESPRASFVMPATTLRYGMSPQSPPLSPTQEDLSLVLGTMQLSRGRSFSTTVQPKFDSGSLSAASLSGSHTHREAAFKPSIVPDAVLPIRRKQSVPTVRGDSRDTSRSAEEFFIDVILQRHARHLLCARRLADLGRMAARLDFQLVAWLARERDRAAQLDDPVAALQQLHEDFHWPHPAVSFPFGKNLDRKASCTLTEEGIRSLSLDANRGGPNSRVGDSGYMSQSGLHGSKLHEEFVDYSGLHNVQEAHLVPHNIGDDRSIVSEESSVWGEDRERLGHFSIEDQNSSWSPSSPEASLTMDQLVDEASRKGSSRAQVQLRYLLQVVTEAGCLEWALVLAVLLRDAMAVVRTAAAARAPTQSYAAVLRLLNIINTLAGWSSTQCLGYKPFMVTVEDQVSVLSSLLSSKQQQQQQMIQQQQEQFQHLSQVGGRSRTTSCNLDTSSQGVTKETSPGKAERILVSSDSSGSVAAPEVTSKTTSVRSESQLEVGTEIGEEQHRPLPAQPETESSCSVS